MMSIGVTFDHRFMDGFQAGKMLQVFRGYLENPTAGEGLVPEAATDEQAASADYVSAMKLS